MPLDVALLRETFREEVAEHARTIDDILFRAEHEEPDREQLDALFRAVHSIKGGCGTFGFPRLGAFAHVLEELLDAVRERTLSLDAEIVDAVLRGNEVIGALLAAEFGERHVAEDEVDAVRAVIATHLAGRRAAVAPTTTIAKRWSIGVVVADRARSERVVEALRAAFAGLGELTVREPRAGEQFRAELHCDRTADDLREMFAFVGMPSDTFLVEPVVEDGGFGFFDDEPAPSLVASPLPDAPVRSAAAATTIRVGVDRIDHLVNLVGELVIAESVLTRAAEAVTGAERAALDAAVAHIRRHTRDLRDGVMSIRMVPLASIFGRFRRVCRELEERLGKSVVLRISGEETELDKGMIERLVDPLTHVLRNAYDHGVETPEERAAAGKPPAATVHLAASHEGGEVVITISDDGRGLDRAAILARARSRGLDVADEAADEEVWNLIFAPGFSTAETVTDVSGRGVGMDVVRRNVTELGGRVDLRSTFGVGTTIRIRLPLTLAILDGLSVRIAEETFVIPLTAIVESLQPKASERLRVGAHEEVLAFRGDYVPIVPLRKRFANAAHDAAPESVCIVVESGTRRAALEVDALDAQLQVVVKSLAANFRPVPGVAGATVLGNGRVALILDVPGLLGAIA
jgi:two-component system chemotaxis sensor kinase CheA